MQPSKGKLWTGRILGIVFVLFMIFDAIVHITLTMGAREGFVAMGVSPSIGPVLGLFVIASLILFVIPRTSAWGAVLLTAYFGGAVASQLPQTLPAGLLYFPIVVAVVMWIAYLLVSPRAWNFFLKKA